jgi:hypothetical protein
VPLLRGILVAEVPRMQSTFIRFVTEEDRIRGFATLAKRARIDSLPGQVYQVPIEELTLLESERISYRRATDAEVKDANDQVRNPAASVLQ